jgi:hypothetical protein
LFVQIETYMCYVETEDNGHKIRYQILNHPYGMPMMVFIFLSLSLSLSVCLSVSLPSLFLCVWIWCWGLNSGFYTWSMPPASFAFSYFGNRVSLFAQAGLDFDPHTVKMTSVCHFLFQMGLSRIWILPWTSSLSPPPE